MRQFFRHAAGHRRHGAAAGMMLAGLATAAALGATGGGPAFPQNASVPVDVELVLAVDSSSSIDPFEFNLQIEGIAQAFRHPEVLGTLQTLRQGIAVTVVHWSAGYRNKQVIPWRRIANAAAAEAFAHEVETGPRQYPGSYTAIGLAIEFSTRLIESNAFAGGRRAIDVSGDGRNNSGPAPAEARDRAIARGITINGLAITDGDDSLGTYYQENVSGGPGSFVMTIDGYRDIVDAMRRKILREIAPSVSDAAPPVTPRRASAATSPRESACPLTKASKPDRGREGL